MSNRQSKKQDSRSHQRWLKVACACLMLVGATLLAAKEAESERFSDPSHIVE